MCIGIPVKIIKEGEFVSTCKGRNGVVDVNMMLIGQQSVGTWVLNFLGSARSILSKEEAININKALDGLEKINQGEHNIDVDRYFPDIKKAQ
ncbi:MAG: HypC/HybG/HupF family hydrogenase formation chaperone [Gammaproteobacteria bacterium]|nr:MAG: HypC/HybG/HupF family hydrogenase formation chaperone [Gammaproteobacteria bacterium]